MGTAAYKPLTRAELAAMVKTGYVGGDGVGEGASIPDGVTVGGTLVRAAG